MTMLDNGAEKPLDTLIKMPRMIHSSASFRIPRMKLPGRLYLAAGLVGVLAGLIGALFHAVLDQAAAIRGTVHGLLSAAPIPGWLLLMPLGALVLIGAMWLVRRFAPETAGSGVQEVEAILAGERTMRWRRVLPVKLFAGSLAVGSGLVLGREGPTIHMGAALGQLMSERLAPSPGDNRTLITAGAGAGLATAFNAPLAAIIFVIEELREHFDYRFATLQSVILACCASVIVSDWLLGKGPDMPLPDPGIAPLHAVPLFALLGVLIGALGALFNRLLLGSVAAFRALGTAGAYWVAGGAGLILGALVWFMPNTVGGGEGLVEHLLHGQLALPLLLALLAVRLLTTVGSYGVGLPGGIFAPMLALGTLCGVAFAALVSLVAPALAMAPEVFAVAAMGALFAATVRAPLTGIVLVIELTGAQTLTLPIVLTCLTATFTAQGMGGRPIYNALLGLGGRPPVRAPVRRIAIVAMILAAFIAVDRIDLVRQGVGLTPVEVATRSHDSATVLTQQPSSESGISTSEDETTPASPPVGIVEEEVSESATGSLAAVPAGDSGSDRMPQTSQGLDDDRTGIAAVTSLLAQVAPPGGEIEVALGVEVAVQPVPVAESSAGSGRPAPAPSSDETLVSPPETTPTATANEGVSSKRAQPRYSIQLISLRETASLEQFARDEGLIGKALRLESDAAAAQRWHPVLLGAYPNRPAADAVLDALPARLRRLSPFVRALGAGEHLVPIGGR